MTELPVILRGASVDAVISFVFDHPVPLTGEAPWYRCQEFAVDADPVEQVRHLTQILRAAETLFPRFSPGQLDQGFWFMFGFVGEAYFARLLADDAIPWSVRSECIEAIYDAYAGLFLDQPLEEAPYMLWDLLLHAWWGEGREPPTEVRDLMFRTLVRILDLPSTSCQRAALHGLGHLRHPRTSSAVSAFLEDAHAIPEDLRHYALQVQSGQEIQ